MCGFVGSVYVYVYVCVREVGVWVDMEGCEGDVCQDVCVCNCVANATYSIEETT